MQFLFWVLYGNFLVHYCVSLMLLMALEIAGVISDSFKN